jgi:hypothetical protein
VSMGPPSREPPKSLGRIMVHSTVKEGPMEVKPTYLGTMIALATAAFGLIAALAWNKFITDLIALFLKPGSGVWAELIYAVIITIIAVIVIQNLAKLAEREIGPGTGPKP